MLLTKSKAKALVKTIGLAGALEAIARSGLQPKEIVDLTAYAVECSDDPSMKEVNDDPSSNDPETPPEEEEEAEAAARPSKPDESPVPPEEESTTLPKEAVEAVMGLAVYIPTIVDEQKRALQKRKAAEIHAKLVRGAANRADFENKHGIDLSNLSKYPPAEVLKLAENVRDTVDKRDIDHEMAETLFVTGVRAIGSAVRAVAPGAGNDRTRAVACKPAVVESAKSYRTYFEKFNQANVDFLKANHPSRLARRAIGTDKKAAVEALMAPLLSRHDGKFAGAWKSLNSGGGGTSEALLMSPENLPNREFITTAILEQVFWEMVYTSLVGAPLPEDVNWNPNVNQFGEMVSIRMENVSQIEPGRQWFETRIEETAPEIKWNWSFASFRSRFHGLAMRVPEELVILLAREPFRYDVLSKVTRILMEEWARSEDLRIGTMIHISNAQYGCLRITNETTQDTPAGGDVNGEWYYNAAGDITYLGIRYGANVCGGVWMRHGLPTGTDPLLNLSPVVPPVAELEDQGTSNGVFQGIKEIQVNPIQFAGVAANAPWGLVGGVTQVMGRLEINPETGFKEIVPNGPGEIPTFAVDYDNGICVFRETAVSGFPGAGPVPNTTFAKYSAETNFVPFSQTVPPGYTRAEWATVLLSVIKDLKIGVNSKRLGKPDFMVGPTTLAAQIGDATAYLPLFASQWTQLSTEFPNDVLLASIAGIPVLGTDAPLGIGMDRLHLFQKGRLMYFHTQPPSIGPAERIHSVSGSRATPIRTQYWRLNAMTVCAPIHKTVTIGPGGTKKEVEWPGLSVKMTGSSPMAQLPVI